MEYKIFHKIRQKIKIPYFFRIIFWIILILFWVFASLIPVIPGFVFVTIWALLLVPADKIKSIRKIRKWFIYLFKNLHSKKIIKRKFFDFFKHWKNIIKNKKKKKIK